MKILAAVAASLVLGLTAWVPARASASDHVEYVVPEPQQGVLDVVQHGQDGLVEVTLDCIVPGKMLTFVVSVTVPEGSTDLSVRKNSGQDVSGWFTLEPAHVSAPGGNVEVHVQIPEGASLSGTAVTRIQEIGDPPAPGGHHGVKVFIDCLQSAPTTTATNTPVTPTATNTPVIPTATATATKVVVIRSATPTGELDEEPVAKVTPTSRVDDTPLLATPPARVQLPNTGMQAGTGHWVVFWISAATALASIGAVMLYWGIIVVRGRI